MINRKILYGYQIRDGALVIVPEEQQTIRMAFTLYIAGTSYQAIADALNHQNIPYCPEAPLWDKHKVKRLLENPRYTGKDGFPAAVDADTFQAARKKCGRKERPTAASRGKIPHCAAELPISAAPAVESSSALAVNGWIAASCTSNVGPAAVPSPQIRIPC